MDEISIIIPVYNEERILEKNVRRLIKYLKKLKLKFEIIIADNGSTDNTSSITRKMSRIYSNVKYIRVDKRGPGEAFKNAIKKAKYQKIIQLDADLTIDYKSFIRRSVDLLDSYDMVIGSKLVKQRRQLYRRILSLSFIILSKILFNLPYSDYSIGAKSYRKDFLLKNIEIIDRWTFYPFKLAYFAKRVKEISIYCFDKRKSKFNLFHEVFYKFYNLIKFRIEANKK